MPKLIDLLNICKQKNAQILEVGAAMVVRVADAAKITHRLALHASGLIFFFLILLAKIRSGRNVSLKKVKRLCHLFKVNYYTSII